MARADSKRYKEAMAGYKSGGAAMHVDSGNESDSEWPFLLTPTQAMHIRLYSWENFSSDVK